MDQKAEIANRIGQLETNAVTDRTEQHVQTLTTQTVTT